MSSAPSDLRVPKHAVTVELALEGRAPRVVEIYLAEQRPHDLRPEDVSDLFGEPPAFLPARDLSEGEFVVVRKEAVAWVAFSGLDDEGELFDARHDVRVELRGGGGLDGELLYSPPEGRGRVVDYLNQTGRFLRLWTPERLYLVNTAYIIRVIEKGG